MTTKPVTPEFLRGWLAALVSVTRLQVPLMRIALPTNFQRGVLRGLEMAQSALEEEEPAADELAAAKERLGAWLVGDSTRTWARRESVGDRRPFRIWLYQGGVMGKSDWCATEAAATIAALDAAEKGER
jgi:hypothetical protein